MKKILLLIILVLFAFVFTFAQNFKEYYLTFEINHKSEINKITRIISIDNVIDQTVYAYATDKTLEKFKQLGYKYTLLDKPGKGVKENLATTIAEMQNWDKYPTYDLYVEMMNHYETTYPEICKVINIGSTVNGRDLLALKISDHINTEEEEPEFLYTSTMHGDETTGFVLMLRLADSLLSAYNEEPDITNLVNNIEIYINPNANPDGTYRNDNSTLSSPTRYNANGVDLNRNFPDPANGIHPDDNTWQPETEAMMNFAKNHHFVLSANFHGGIELANYPWDHTYRRHSDDNWFKRVSREYATSAQNNSPYGYFTGQNNGITNGADWYVVYGSRQDYFTYYHNSREITFEISDSKFVPGSSLPNYWNYNKEALFQYMKESLYGIKGTVKNNHGEPLDAMIFIENHDSESDSSMVFTDPDIGDYHRMIDTGTYNIIASSHDYYNDTIKNLNISQYSAVKADFILYKDSIQSSLNINEITDTISNNTIKHYPIVITNIGESVINYSISEEDDEETWVTLNKKEGQISVNNKDTVIVEINSEGLETDDYQTNLIYSEPDGAKTNISIKINVQSTLSIYNETFRISNIRIYPNPFTDFLTIDLNDSSSGEIFLSIYSLTGKKIFEQTYNNKQHKTLHLNNLSKGVYILKIKTNENVFLQKIIKTKD